MTSSSRSCWAIMSAVSKVERANIASQCSDADFGFSSIGLIGFTGSSISAILPCGARMSTSCSKCWSVLVRLAISATGGRPSASTCAFIGLL